MSIDKLLNLAGTLAARLLHAENELALLRDRLARSEFALKEIGGELGRLKGQLAAQCGQAEEIIQVLDPESCQSDWEPWQDVANTCPPL